MYIVIALDDSTHVSHIRVPDSIDLNPGSDEVSWDHPGAQEKRPKVPAPGERIYQAELITLAQEITKALKIGQGVLKVRGDMRPRGDYEKIVSTAEFALPTEGGG
jgi:hypothetical protein